MRSDTKSEDDPPPDRQITPKGHEIPVPKREDVMRDLARVAPPQPDAPKRAAD